MDVTLRRVLERIRSEVRARRLWDAGDQILCACSGGLDSVTLVALLKELEPSLGHYTQAGWVDHGLQPSEAAREAVKQVATSRQLPWLEAAVHVKTGPGLQGRARDARYRALIDMAERAACKKIATAHHADDQAETFLMRAARGAGVTGMSGVRAQRDDIVRPLLGVSRRELLTCARALDLRWWEDPTNGSPRFTRNALRQRVLEPLHDVIPDAARGLSQAAMNAHSADVAVRYWVRAAVGPWRRRGESVGVAVDKIPAPLEAGCELYRAMIEECLAAQVGPRALRQLHHAALLGSGCDVRGLRAYTEDDVFWIAPARVHDEPPNALK